MGILMLINWFKILCLTTAFCVRNLIFGAHFMLGSTEREEFTMLKPYVYSSDSTLALYTCLFVIWCLTYCHIPCLLRHTVRTEEKIFQIFGLVIMCISNLNSYFELMKPSLGPRVLLVKAQNLTLFQKACFDVL